MNKKLKNIILISLSALLCLLLVLGLVFGIKGCRNRGQNDDISSSDIDNTDITDTFDELGDETENWDETEEDFFEEEDDYFEDEDYAEPILINNDEPYLNKNFRGFNGVYMLFTHMQHPSYGCLYTEEQAKTELDRIESMGVKIVRTTYSGGMVYKSVGTGANKKWEAHWDDSPYLNAFIKTAKELKNRDIDIMLPFTWYLGSFTSTAQPHSFGDGYFPASITGTGWAMQSDTGYGSYHQGHSEEEQEKLLVENTKTYKQFVKDSIAKFRAEGLTNIKYINGFTECNNAYMKDGIRDYEKAGKIFDAAITATHEALKEINLRSEYKIVGPCDNFGGDFEEFDEEKYSYLVKYTLDNLTEEVDIIGTHNGYDRANDFAEDDFYARPNRTLSNPMKSALAAGKEFWIDEYNVATHVPYTQEQKRDIFNNVASGVAFGSMVNGIMNMGGVSNVFVWMLAEQQWPHEQNGGEFDKGVQIGSGYMPNLFESSIPKTAWYSYAMIQRYVGSGKLIKCNDGADPEFQAGYYYSCIERDDGELTLIVTNYEVFDMNIEVTFLKELSGKTFYKHEYAIADVAPTADAIVPEICGVGKNVKKGFFDTVKPYSVTVYTTDKK